MLVYYIQKEGLSYGNFNNIVWAVVSGIAYFDRQRSKDVRLMTGIM